MVQYFERMRELRVDRGLTQTALVKDLIESKAMPEIKESTYRMWELGRSEPSISSLISLSDYYEVTIDYIVGRSISKGTRIVTSQEKDIAPNTRGEYLSTLNQVSVLYSTVKVGISAARILSTTMDVIRFIDDKCCFSSGELLDVSSPQYNEFNVSGSLPEEAMDLLDDKLNDLCKQYRLLQRTCIINGLADSYAYDYDVDGNQI